MNTETEKNLSYSIIFDVPESGVEVNTFAEGMRDCLLALEEINNAIVGGIDTSIQVVSYIERLSAGSVDFELKDQIKNSKNERAEKAIEATVAGVASVYGDSSGMILLSLKAAKDAIFKINEKRISNKQKRDEIKSEITTILKNSNLNNDLKGYYLDEKRLNSAIGHFAKGVKKTGDNVFYKSTTESEKFHINSSLADTMEDQDKNDQEEEEKILQSTNAIEDIYTLLTPTSKEDCKWEFDDNGSKIKCTMDDKEFFNKYLSKTEKLGGNENLKLKMKVETFLQGNKVKKEYTILKVIGTIPDRNLFNYQDDKTS